MQNTNKVNNSFILLTRESSKTFMNIYKYSLTIFSDFSKKKITECIHF